MSSVSNSSSASRLESDVMAQFASLQSSTLRIAECEHCGITCAGGEVYCECADLIKAYGATKCDCCGIEYGCFPGVMEYIAGWGYEGEDFAYDFYMTELKRIMPAPCDKCSTTYISERMKLIEKYELWKSKQPDRYEWDDGRQWDEPPCISHRTLCPCCGDCP